jgi:4'-phosphopantetheinyl transferase
MALPGCLPAHDGDDVTTQHYLRWLARGEGHLPADRSWLAGGELARVAGLRYAKRRTEYLVARWTAKETLARSLGLSRDRATLARIEGRNGVTGAPKAYLEERPLDLSISLTDRAGWAVCLVASGGGRVGCDLEMVEPRSQAFVRDYLTDDEQRFAAAAPDDLAGDLVPNLFWSAKESALKVLRTGLRRDTRSVQVTVAEELRPGGWAPLTVRTSEDAVFSGWWARFGDFLLTAVSDSAATPTMAPPAALEDPPALAGAEPTHSWLAPPLWS